MTAAKKLKWVARVLLVLAAIVALALLWLSVSYGQHGRARKAWLRAAVAEIERDIADPSWASSEIAALGARPLDPLDSDTWLSDRLVLMKDGSWLAYRNVCQKQDPRVYDLFIARGSDGKWYYSTYHFCIGMLVLRTMHPQPDSIRAFVTAYSLKDFDGRSDEALEPTWHPERQPQR